MSVSPRLALATLALALSAPGLALAADAPAKPRTSQQQRMADCNHQATGKKGDERRAFMSQCLKKQPAAPLATVPDSATADACAERASAAALEGEERTVYLRACRKTGSQ